MEKAPAKISIGKHCISPDPMQRQGVGLAVTLSFLVLWLVLGGLVPDESRAGYQDELLEEAVHRNLAAERSWLTLLHYRPKTVGGRSLITDPAFFRSPDGGRDPRAELEATLKGFFLPAEAGDRHPICVFPARYAWLKEQLGIDEKRLPRPVCGEYDNYMERLEPRSALLVFPAAYMNNPASMFGHTLLRIDGGYESGLLAYAVNYAAFTDDTNGIVYAYKGVFGLYPGYFSLLPYDAKVKEYNDLEHRDMWEYSLNLSPEEVRRMVRHTWELKNIRSSYYFFDENCSYQILFLLEAARPSLRLTERKSLAVIPSDTIRTVRASGLITGMRYRPSQAKRMRAIASRMEGDEEPLALKLAAGDVDPGTVLTGDFSPAGKARILDLAAEFLQYRYARQELEKDEFSRRFVAVLKARSTVGRLAAEDAAVPTPPDPEQGHGSLRLSVGAGFRDGDYFSELSGRLAYHGLDDPDTGYLEGSQILFGSTSLRHYPHGNRVRLESLHLIDIASYSPRDGLFRPFSWKVNTGVDQELLRDGEDHLIYRLNTGGGMAYKNETAGIAYFLGEADLNLGERLRDKFALGAGVSAGLQKTFGDCWKIHLAVQGMYYALGDEHGKLRASLAQNFRITPNNSLELTLYGEESFSHYQSEIKLAWNFYL